MEEDREQDRAEQTEKGYVGLGIVGGVALVVLMIFGYLAPT